jgi:Bacterial aa3 type cytochrome c oxidase subunit IV
MADQNQPGTDNRATYNAFMAMTKWGVGVVAVILIVLALVFAR